MTMRYQRGRRFMNCDPQLTRSRNRSWLNRLSDTRNSPLFVWHNSRWRAIRFVSYWLQSSWQRKGEREVGWLLSGKLGFRAGFGEERPVAGRERSARRPEDWDWMPTKSSRGRIAAASIQTRCILLSNVATRLLALSPGTSEGRYISEHCARLLEQHLKFHS